MERASARDLVMVADSNRLFSTDSSMAAERASCLRGISISICQSGRAEEEAMADTVSYKKIEGGGERPRSPSTKGAEQRDESKCMQQEHEVGRYAAQALLYYKGGMPSATTSPIKGTMEQSKS